VEKGRWNRSYWKGLFLLLCHHGTSSHPKALINISTGMHATREIQESLTGTVDEGMKMLQSFVNNMGFIPVQGCWFCLLMNSFFGAGLT
jgi:hypothetical protein